jgi:hypothetical protein
MPVDKQQIQKLKPKLKPHKVLRFNNVAVNKLPRNSKLGSV